MKKLFTIAFLVAIFSVVGCLFWYSEWQYSLPTPLPKNYHAVATSQTIALGNRFIAAKQGPVFLHFFNPDCPCSKFNIPHFRSLVSEYGSKVNFAIVVLSNNKSYTEATIQKKFGIAVPVLFDSSLAALCGVYSTPQAVLINHDDQLYYRGNYNKSRYCADKKNNYAQIALEALLAQKQNPVSDRFALTAYGCTLPNCTP